MADDDNLWVWEYDENDEPVHRRMTDDEQAAYLATQQEARDQG